MKSLTFKIKQRRRKALPAVAGALPADSPPGVSGAVPSQQDGGHRRKWLRRSRQAGSLQPMVHVSCSLRVFLSPRSLSGSTAACWRGPDSSPRPSAFGKCVRRTSLGGPRTSLQAPRGRLRLFQTWGFALPELRFCPRKTHPATGGKLESAGTPHAGSASPLVSGPRF